MHIHTRTLRPQVPCIPSMVACNNTPIPTELPSSPPKWPFEQVGASYTIPGTQMPIQQTAWSSMTTVPLSTNAAQFLWATHVCSYLCFTSQFVAGDTNNNCLLLNATAAELGNNSYCVSFPTTPPYP